MGNEIVELPTPAYLAKMLGVIADDARCDGCYILTEDDQHLIVAAAVLIERQEQRIRELDGALEVFAKAADTHSEKMPDQMFIDDYEHPSGEPWKSAAGLTVGDLRRARAALQKEE